MHDIDLDELIDRVLPCLERHADGRNETTRRRRREVVRFFHFCTLYAGPDVPAALPDLLMVFDDCSDALDRDLDEPAGDDELAQLVFAEVGVVWHLARAGVEAVCVQYERGAPNEAAEIAARQLQQIFDWDQPGHLRAFVFVHAGERLGTDLLHKERSLLIAELRKCLDEDHR